MIRSILAATAAIALVTSAHAQEAQPATDGVAEAVLTTLTVKLTGLKVGGVVKIGVYASEAAYNSGKATSGAEVAVTDTVMTVEIPGLATGEYGLKLYHDRNDNDKMDTNPFGMPTEPFAFSNNAKGNFGPASWDKARFEVTAEGAVQAIELN